MMLTANWLSAGLCKRCLYNPSALLQAEGRRFIAALERAAVGKRSALFEGAELYNVADRIELQAEVPALLEDLRDAGGQFTAYRSGFAPHDAGHTV